MKPRRTWLLACLSAGAVLLALLAWFGVARTASAPPAAATSDFDQLKRIPTIDIVRMATLVQLLPLVLDDDQARAATVAEINALDRDLRSLMWLAWLDDQWGRDGLHTFFFLDGGDFAPQVLAALRHAKLDREAAVFADAMALFGPAYPTDHSTREKPFAWSQPGRRIDAVTTLPNEPNKFDRALMAKGSDFGTQDDLTARITHFIDSTPALQAWAAQARADLSDEQRLNWLLSQLGTRFGDGGNAGLTQWPPSYRQLFLLEVLNAEQLNGGVHQFFYNASGDLAPEIVATLKEVGLPRHAAALQRSVDMFGVPYPSDNAARRASHFAKEWSAWDEQLNAVTDDIDDGAIFETMLGIAKRDGLLPH
jgi:hypothetical protein